MGAFEALEGAVVPASEGVEGIEKCVLSLAHYKKALKVLCALGFAIVVPRCIGVGRM
jgi:hypothetical protein